MYILSRAIALSLLFVWMVIPIVLFASEEEKININVAPLEDLVKIVHLGETRALELISLRPFSSLDELSKINGISELRIEDIKNQGMASVEIENQKEIFIKETPQEYPKNIIFTELLPSPEGPDSENEWIEIFNKNNFEVDLSNWQIIDINGATKIFTFSKGQIISANEYLLLYRGDTKITLNNNQDGLQLLNPLKEIVDSVNYENAENKKSLSLVGISWLWNEKLTPGGKNIYNEKTEVILEKDEILSKNNEETITTIETKKNYNYGFIATLTALISTTSILLIKKNARIR